MSEFMWLTEKCQRLEVERDQALRERDIWQAAAELWQTNHAVREHERDEAQREAVSLRHQLADAEQAEFIREQERDEARATARDLFGGDNMTSSAEAKYIAKYPWLTEKGR